MALLYILKSFATMCQAAVLDFHKCPPNAFREADVQWKFFRYCWLADGLILAKLADIWGGGWPSCIPDVAAKLADLINIPYMFYSLASSQIQY
jgi:hypothetical protein